MQGFGELDEYNMNETKNIQIRINEIRSLQTAKISHFQYSKTAKIPFKVHEFIEIMNCRMLDFCEAADSLMKNNHVIPSLALIRALIENAAIGFRVASAIKNSLKSNELIDNFDSMISSLTFGTGYASEFKATSILTHLDKLDKTYKGIKMGYEALCEFVHPNWDGVQGSYSILNENEKNTEVKKVITPEHQIYKWVEDTFIITIEIYLDYTIKIKDDLPAFSLLCEKQFSKK